MSSPNALVMRTPTIVLHDEDADKPGAVLKPSNVTPSYLVFKGGSYDQTFEKPGKCP
jgi:hypothetical protein